MDIPQYIYACQSEGEGPWEPGDRLLVTPTEPYDAIIRVTPERAVTVYPIFIYHLLVRDVFAGALAMEAVAPHARELIRDQMSRSLGSRGRDEAQTLGLVG